jgi:hypothetical protein
LARAQVQSFLADERTVAIPTEDGEPIEVTYRPSRRTPEFARRFAEIQGDTHKLWVFTICTLVTSWNLYGPLEIELPKVNSKGKPVVDDYGVSEFTTKVIVKDGELIPLTSDVLRHFKTEQLAAIVAAIFEDGTPDPKSES